MAADVLQKLGGASPASDAHVGVHLPQGVAHSGEVAAQVLHHVLDAAGVFEQVDALSVRVVVHRERALYRLCKLSAGKEARTGSHGGLGPGRSLVPVQTLKHSRCVQGLLAAYLIFSLASSKLSDTK